MRLPEVKNKPLAIWVAGVWFAFLLLICIFMALINHEGANILSHWMTLLSAATAFTFPLPWLTARRRWLLWTGIGIFTIYLLIAVSYWRNFGSMMPHSAIFQVGNVDNMVLESAQATFKLVDLLLFIPLAGLITGWFLYWRDHKRELFFNPKEKKLFLYIMVGTWSVLRIISFIHYEINDSSYHNIFDDIKAKYRGKLTTRFNYILNNGMEMYLLWGFNDFFPARELDSADRKFINEFLNQQNELWKPSPPTRVRPMTKPNLLIIMVESFETWAIDYKINGKPVLPYLDSLTRAPGSLYFPHLVSQVSDGHSSDGHLIDLTGLLPLRENAAVTDFYDNDYPSLPKAFKQKYGGHTYEIISDVPSMWKQTETFRHYGFEKLYHFDHIDPEHKSSWTQRDSYLCKYMEQFVDTVQQPFAAMCVTLSLHTPYRTEIKGYPEIDCSDIDPQSVHYLKVCRMDEQYIRRIINALSRRGIYDNTVIAITGDHCAYSLFNEHRPASVAGREKFIPLLVLNTGFPTKTYTETAGQADIYPTLLDILDLGDYKWRGVGVSLLRYTPAGAMRRNNELVGNSSSAEKERQKKAWDVSDLLIRSNELSKRN